MNKRVREQDEQMIIAMYRQYAGYYLYHNLGKIKLYKKIADTYKVHWRTIENHVKKKYDEKKE